MVVEPLAIVASYFEADINGSFKELAKCQYLLYRYINFLTNSKNYCLVTELTALSV